MTALPLTGCGGGDRLSEEAFAARADDACERALGRLQELGIPQTGEEIGDFYERSAEINRDYVADLRRLRPPEEDQEKLDTMVAKLEEATDKLPTLKEAAADQDLAGAQELTSEISSLTREANDIAQELGLQECVFGGAAEDAPHEDDEPAPDPEDATPIEEAD